MLEMHPDFDRIVDDAFTRLQAGEEISEILARYPEHAERLAPLLEVAAFCVRAYTYTEPASADGMARQRERYLALARQQAARQKRSRQPVRWMGRWAMVAAAILLAFVLGTAAVTVSASSVPGDLLYPVKIAVEEVRTAVTFDPAERAVLHMTWSQRRLDELAALLARRDRLDEGLVAASQAEALAALQEIARLPEAERKALLVRYATFARVQAQTLERHASQVPSPQQTVLTQAADKYRNLASVAEAAQEQPEVLPPPVPTRRPTPTPTRSPTPHPTPTARPMPTHTPTRARPVIATVRRRPTRTATPRRRATPTPTRHRPQRVTPTPTQRKPRRVTPTPATPFVAVTVTQPVRRPTVTPTPTRARRTPVATAVPFPTPTPRPVEPKPTPTPTQISDLPTPTPTLKKREPTPTPTPYRQRPTRTPSPTPPIAVTAQPTGSIPQTPTPVPIVTRAPTPTGTP